MKAIHLLMLTMGLWALAHASAAAEPIRVGSGPDALPAVYEVPLLAPAPLGIAARFGLGYGRTEAVLRAGDSHHRMQLDAAASLKPLPFLAASARLLGRYDLHAGGPDDGDYGVVTETHLAGRVEHSLAPTFRVGSRLALWFPGADSLGDAPGAVSGDLQLLGTYLPDASPLTLGAVVGLRVDRSVHSGGDPRRYSLSDRLALGASDSELAAHFGVAMSYRLGSLDLLAEWSWRMYFDYASTSPMWLRAGARYRPSRLVQLEALLGVSPSKRPSITNAAPLAVVEPRFSAGIAAALAFPWEANDEPEQVESAPEVVTTATLHGRVAAANAAGIAGVRVRLSRGEAVRDVTTDASGEFSAAGLAPGAYRVQMSAPGFVAYEESLQLAAGDARELDVTLKRELPKGQIRGTVRQFNGQPVEATIVIAALEIKEQNTEDGSFEVDVPPGEYEVQVKAPGFKTQTRRARVEEDGVAILIVELERSSRK